MKFKLDFIRDQFPAFSQGRLRRVIHADNAGGSYMAGAVIDRLDQYIRNMRVQPGHPHMVSQDAEKAMQEGYEAVAGLLNTTPEWIHVGPSTTQNIYVLANAFGRALKEGDNIIVTNQDHEANSGPWRRLQERGIEIREWQVDEAGHLHKEGLEALVDDKTRLAAFPHVSNIIGEINPVAEITAFLREKGIVSVVDGVSYAPHAWPDIQALGADIYLFSTYKTYGPHQGVMAVNPELAQKLPVEGHEFNANILAKRLVPAGPDHAQIAALSGMADYVSAIYERHKKTQAPLFEMAADCSRRQRKSEDALLAMLFEGLASLKDLTIIGPSKVKNRVPTVSLYHKDLSGHEIAHRLRKHSIIAAGGHFYAPRVLRALNIAPEHGVLRISLVHYTSEKEVKQIIKALKRVIE